MPLFCALILIFVAGAQFQKQKNHIKNDCRVFHLDQQHFNHGCCVSQGRKSLHFSFIKKQHSSNADGQTGGEEQTLAHSVHHSSLS